MKLYIIRHGETDYNKKRLLQGQSDIPLNEYGRELAQITAKALSKMSFDKIYSSPLIRAFETAKILTGRNDIITDKRLMEISFGIGEGVESSTLGETFSNFFFAPEKYIPPENGESYEELVERAKDFLEKEIYPLRNSNQNVLIVAHGAVNKALMLILKDLEIKDIWKGEFQKNCCVNAYDLSENHFEILYEARIFYEGETTDYLKR